MAKQKIGPKLKIPRMSYLANSQNSKEESMSLNESRSLLSNRHAWNSKLLTPSVTIDSVDFDTNPPSELVPLSPSVSVYTERSSLTITPGGEFEFIGYKFLTVSVIQN